MPEERAPFIHKDGQPPALHETLSTNASIPFLESLGRQVAQLQREGSHPQALAMLKAILEPATFTILSVLLGLEPSERSLVADLALRLLDKRARPRVLRDLRKLLEKHT